MTLQVSVIAPDETVWNDEVEEIVLPSTTGQLGILTGHVPLLTALDIGVMRVRPGKEWKTIALMGGFAEVENNEVKVLVNGAQLGETIDKEAAGNEFKQAQASFDEAQKSDDRQQKIQTTQALKKARARFQAAGGMVQI
ncbi:MAG: F0F1 ATP synthase subunit epsilon [Moorea sp. SIO2B7]|nr:F0F1 ATP synthase subunit epsilon [Moorena sp. SIO2B7]